mgnify:FL=1|tara:strand:+ start:3755 stop:4114 length:360 start_codon:yes stop_codon:yes gene_type:complete
MFNWSNPTVQMLGRWQPWHNGHTELFEKALEKTGQVCIMVREMPRSDTDPLNFFEVTTRIINALREKEYTHGEEFVVIKVPNITNITYGRDVGYSITKETLDKEIESISATQIRQQGNI